MTETITTGGVTGGGVVDLLPCPFCGAAPLTCADDGYGDCGIGCVCEAEPFVKRRADDMPGAIAAWNRRAA